VVRRRQTLLIDADDTLWENNGVFERITTEFVTWLDHPEGIERARAVQQEINRALCQSIGYGTATFTRGLSETVAHLRGRAVSEAEARHLAALVKPLDWQDIEVIAGVPETLAVLGERHDLVLLTKGSPIEQHTKIRLSGLGEFFRRHVVVTEKSVAIYEQVVAEDSLDPAFTWMIGNSPRSDILPSVAAGLSAVYIPHPETWEFEHAEIPADHERILHLDRFADLAHHF
jgi:putative hydrolase of the HAD superfamily